MSRPETAIRPTALPSARAPSSSARANRARSGRPAARTRARGLRRTTGSSPGTVEGTTEGTATTSPPGSGRTGGRPIESPAPEGRGAPSRTTRSATASSAGRCTTSTTVRPSASRRTASTIAASVSPSSEAVGSSSSSTGRSARNARASARRWRWPADSPAPSSPRRVSVPCGSMDTNSSAPAARSADRTCASVAPGRASRTFSATVPAKRWGRCGTQATWSRQLSGESDERSAPSTSTRPLVGRSRPSSTFSRVDLPVPLAPVTATVSPARIANEVSASEGSARPAWRTTSRSTVRVAPRASGAGRVPDGAGSVSRTAKTSSAAARPSAAAWYCAPTWRSGR